MDIETFMRKLQPKSFVLFLEQVSQGNNLHWYFGAGGGALFFCMYWKTIYAQAIILLIFIFIAANFIFTRTYHRISKRTGLSEEKLIFLKKVAFVQALFDLVWITIVIHFSGGEISPFPLLYILYIGSISIFFPRTLLILLNAIALILYSGLMQVYLAHVLVSIIPLTMQHVNLEHDFVRNIEFIYIAAMILNGLVIFIHMQKVQVGWQDANAQNDYLDRLHALTKEGLEYAQSNNLYHILANKTCELLGADNVYITRWEDQPGQVVSAAASGEIYEDYVSLSPITENQVSMTQSVRRAGHPLVAEDVLCSPYLSLKIAAHFPSRSLLGIPLYGFPGRRFLGALLVGYNKLHYYSPAEIERAQQTVDVTALLISRTRLYEETLRRADLLEHLANQVTNLTSDLHQTTLLPAVVEVASNLLHAQRAALHLYDRETQEMRCEFSIGLSDDYVKQITQRFNRVPGAQVLKDKAYVLVPDVHQDSKTSPIQDLIASEKFRAYAVFALPSPRGPIGALSLYWDEARVISADEISVAELFAQRAGVLLYSAGLYKQASEKSLTDALTGLPNRRALDEILEQERQQAGDRYNRRCALLMIDLDGFKQINDTYGHPIGDSVLQQVTGVLRRSVRSTDFISRYGGDEFAIILPESGIEEANYVAEKLKTTFGATRLHLPNDVECFISASIGIAICPNDTFEYKKLLSIADQRLYDAKHTGKLNMIRSR
jgi:diguanylate cyclase (GGDEF)-like protein